MKRLTIFSLTCLFSVGAVFAQQGVTQCGVPTGQPKFPLLTYQELPDPTAPSDKEWAAVTSTLGVQQMYGMQNINSRS